MKARPLLGARLMDVSAVAVAGRGLVDPREPVFAADDEALLRGRSVFETVRVYGGRPFRLDEHLARLRRLGRARAPAAARRGRVPAPRRRRDRRVRRRERPRAAALLDGTNARRDRRPDRPGARGAPRARPAAGRRPLVDRSPREREVDELRREHGRAGRSGLRRSRRRAARRARRNRARGADRERLLARGRPSADAGARAADPRRSDTGRGDRDRRPRRWRRASSRSTGCSARTRCSSARRSARSCRSPPSTARPSASAPPRTRCSRRCVGWPRHEDPRPELDAGRGVSRDRRPDRPARRLDRAARLPLARDRQHPRRASVGRCRRAARHPGYARDRVRRDRVHGVPGQPDAAGVDARRRPRGRRGLARRPGLRPGARRERPRRQHRAGPGVGRRRAGIRPLARALGRAPGRDRGGDRPRLRPRVLVGELPLDAAPGSRDADRAQAAGRVAEGRERPARRRGGRSATETSAASTSGRPRTSAGSGTPRCS